MNVPEQHEMLSGADDAKDAPRLIARVSSIAVKAAFPFIAADEIRLYLCGVNIRPLESGGVVVIATDGHRFLMVRDPGGYAEEEIIARVSKDGIKHAGVGVTFDVMSNGSASLNDETVSAVFIQPGRSLVEGKFPRIESVIDKTGYKEGISGAVNANYLADALKIKTGANAPAIRFFTKNEDSPLLFILSGIGEIEVVGGIMKMRDTIQWLPSWIPANGEFELQGSAA